MALLLSDLTAPTRAAFRARVSGDPTGAPDWVRDIARVGAGPGWFEPDGVVWRVHGDLSTLVGGVAALLGQGAHPLALAGVQRHSAYREDPWKRLAGTARWLVGRPVATRAGPGTGLEQLMGAGTRRTFVASASPPEAQPADGPSGCQPAVARAASSISRATVLGRDTVSGWTRRPRRCA